MCIFKHINVNLYKMYFKDELKLKNQYEYLKLMYQWSPKAISDFEKGRFNPHNTAYRWMHNGIPDAVFSLLDSNKTILDSPDLYDICYDNLKSTIYLTNNEKLSKVLYAIIFDSKTAVDEPFEWDKRIQQQMEQIYKSSNSTQMLCTLLIFAQTKKIYTSRNILHLKNDFSYVKAYKKDVITRFFDSFFEDAVKVNMSQISIPSLLDSYKEFYKSNNNKSIIELLKKDPDFKLNLLMIDPHLQNIEILLNAYMYGDPFASSIKVIEDSIRYAHDLMKEYPNQVTAKTVAVPMSYSYMQIRNKEKPSTIKLDIYAPFNNADDRISMIIDDMENKELYDYYSKTFYRMFYDGKLISESSINPTDEIE